MNAGDLGGNASERPSAGAARLRVPGLELTGRAAQPEKDAMFLRFLRRRREDLILEQPSETRHSRQRAARQAFQEMPAMKHVFVRRALAWSRGV